jgi:hypothetical protein
MKCKCKLYKTQFLPLLVRILKPMRFKCKIYKTQSLPLPLGVFKPKCKIYKTQVLLMSLSQGAVRSSQGNLEINDPVNLLREAYQRYSDAKQTPE